MRFMMALMICHTPFLDGPYRPKSKPRNGYLRTKVLVTTVLLSAIGLSAAAAMLKHFF